MKKIRIVLLLLVVSIFIFPFFVNAENVNKNQYDEEHAILIDKTTKYLKTVTVYENIERDSYGNIKNGDVISSDTYELTKEEYEASNFENTEVTRGSTTITANYKIMTTTLTYSNGVYRYRNQVNWTTFPSVRSFDVIGIGHYSDVTISGTPSFVLEYYTLSGAHFTTYFYTAQSWSRGDSATFNLPLPNLSSLTITYSYDVQKVGSGTITSQVAVGDYAHGIDSSLTLSQALNHEVIQGLGICHNSSVANKFDTMPEAATYWSGTW